MPFLMQPSPFPGLGLAPPMAPITVEAGSYMYCYFKSNSSQPPYSIMPECWSRFYNRDALQDINKDWAPHSMQGYMVSSSNLTSVVWLMSRGRWRAIAAALSMVQVPQKGLHLRQPIAPQTTGRQKETCLFLSFMTRYSTQNE
jgi:hypothetical protein